MYLLLKFVDADKKAANLPKKKIYIPFQRRPHRRLGIDAVCCKQGLILILITQAEEVKAGERHCLLKKNVYVPTL